MPLKERQRKTDIHWNIRIWGLVIVAVLLSAFFIRWTEWHTKRAEAAYEAYDKCVERVYGVSSAEFYQVYGRIAKCD